MTNCMTTYRTVRLYFDEGKDSETLETGLTLEEARATCSDPETSSSTCTTEEGRDRTLHYGMWFVGYEEEL